ncbi:F510_1955 family glycosylhydrolase [Gracilibacillus xinjiangensis]|uniref:F510_1955 family glycosylhydrolase n=1 Tax=Gracilibacillus xinjiangensis TaxID=1193282 RepID=A0ABV8WVZ2_9BACI
MKQLLLVTMTLFTLTACSNNSEPAAFEQELEGSLTHVHGMGFNETGDRLLFGTHEGLKFSENGKWFETTKNMHDYMGFVAVDQGFYTSGHPGKQSDLPNPIGIQRSFDDGRSLESIDFEGESDIHFLAVGYYSHDIFIYNPDANSKLEAGYYLSENNGKTWTKLNGSNIKGNLFHVAIHPHESQYLAAATTDGIYFSKDKGKSFNLITNQSQGTAVYFNEDTLFYSTDNGQPSLVAYNWGTGKETNLNLPELKEDAPLFISQNPQSDEVLAIYTIKGSGFISTDGAKSWQMIINQETVEDVHDHDHSSNSADNTHQHHSSTGEVPDELENAENPTFETGSKAMIRTDHMPGMDGAEATISGAYHTTVYAVSYDPVNGGERVENHKWVVHEELLDAGTEPLAIGDTAVINTDHMPGMKGATATIDSVEETTVYMVDFIATDSGEEILNHKWVTEDELESLD